MRCVFLIKRISTLFLMLSSAVARAQETPPQEEEAVGQSVNYVFATDLGSGLYDLNGRSLQVYRYTYEEDLRPVDEKTMGVRFVLPVTAGFFDFNPVDVIESGPPTRVDSLSIVPGIELDYLLDNDWHLIPYARAGSSIASSSVNGWLYGAGVRLERHFQHRKWDTFVRTELVYAGVNYTDRTVPSDEFERARQAFSMYRGSGWKARGHEFEFGFYGVYDIVIDPPTAPVANIQPEELQVEAGMMFGMQPAIKVWKFHLPRIGFGYRQAGELSGWRLVFGEPF
jgi:hypothetical protein